MCTRVVPVLLAVTFRVFILFFFGISRKCGFEDEKGVLNSKSSIHMPKAKFGQLNMEFYPKP